MSKFNRNQLSPAQKLDKRLLQDRLEYNLEDYGVAIDHELENKFLISSSALNAEDALVFFSPLEDIVQERFSLLNFHCYNKKTGNLEHFIRNLAACLKEAPLKASKIFGLPCLNYQTRIKMKDLFKGLEHVIQFIGGSPEKLVHAYYSYFVYEHRHYYVGMIHESQQLDKYLALRANLIAGIRLC